MPDINACPLKIDHRQAASSGRFSRAISKTICHQYRRIKQKNSCFLVPCSSKQVLRQGLFGFVTKHLEKEDKAMLDSKRDGKQPFVNVNVICGTESREVYLLSRLIVNSAKGDSLYRILRESSYTIATI